MNSGKASGARYHSRLSRRLLLRFVLALVGWLVGFTGLCLLAMMACNTIIWQPWDPVYQFLQFVKDFLPVFYFVPLLGGWLAISYYFLGRPLRYLDEIVAAAKLLAQPRDEMVRLPGELKDIEDDMNLAKLNLAKQRALRDAEAAKEAEQRKNDLIVYLAHDLKTPLTSVIGYLTLLRDEPQLSPEMRARYTNIALEKALRLEDLTNEFFEITRFNLSHMELEKAPVDLALMLRQVASEFEPALAKKGLSCRVELPQAMPYECDADKMARVFDNLLRNAMLYSFENTTVYIRGTSGPQGVELHFENEGRTIPPEKLARVFEQFFRLDSARSTSTGGAGLGLAIAKQIVELHGGTISAASADNKVKFTVTLPPAGTP